MINLNVNSKNYINSENKFNPKKLFSLNLAFGAEEEQKSQKNNGINKKILVGAGITIGGFLADLFVARGKILSTLTKGKVSFVKTMSEELDNAVKNDAYATKGRLEAFLSIPGLHALWGHRVIHNIHEWKVPVIPRFLANISRFITGIEIHPGAKLGKNVFFDHTGAIIGETAEIGNNVTIIGRTVLGSTGKNGFLRHTIVEDGVTIGINSTMLGRIKLGENSKIGAGAVVTHDVPKGATIIGNPAKIIALNNNKLKQPLFLTKNSVNELKEAGEKS